MAVLQKQISPVYQVFDLTQQPLPPKGTFIANCDDVRDVFGVERKKYQSEATERVDLTAFLFSFKTKQGMQCKIASKAMKISTNEKSALMDFLKSWLGHAPAMGWDYCDMRGKKALITVDHELRKSGDGFYATIVSISPLPDSLLESPMPAKSSSSAPASAAAPVEVPDDEKDNLAV